MEPGRVAIDRAVYALHPDTLDHRMGLSAAPGEELPPLEEVVAFREGETWHYVSYGLSELGEKVSEIMDRSGFGIELSFRLAAGGEDTPPSWPIQFLRWLAKRVWNDGVPYGDGHSMPLPDGLLEAIGIPHAGAGFVRDPSIGALQSSTGTIDVLQVVVLHPSEYLLFGRWDAAKIFTRMRQEDPLLAYRPGRPSLLDGPQRDAIVAEAARDGAAQEVDFTSDLAWGEDGIIVDALNRFIVMKFLRYRVAYGRDATIHSEGRRVTLAAGAYQYTFTDEGARLVVPRDRAATLADTLASASADSEVRIDGSAAFVVSELEPLGPLFSFV